MLDKGITLRVAMLAGRRPQIPHKQYLLILHQERLISMHILMPGDAKKRHFGKKWR
jgi:hypothetical protein